MKYNNKIGGFFTIFIGLLMLANATGKFNFTSLPLLLIAGGIAKAIWGRKKPKSTGEQMRTDEQAKIEEDQSLDAGRPVSNEHVYCQYCGEPGKSGQKICKSCGKKLRG